MSSVSNAPTILQVSPVGFLPRQRLRKSLSAAKSRCLSPQSSRSMLCKGRMLWISLRSTSDSSSGPSASEASSSSDQFPVSRDARRKSLKEVSVGQVMDGVVKNVVPFGCFVDIGCVEDVLVHRTDFAEGYCDNPSLLVSKGDKVKLEVIQVKVNQLKGSFRKLMGFDEKLNEAKSKPSRTRTRAPEKTYQIGETFEATVQKVVVSGAVLAFDGDSTGFLPVEELPEAKKMEATELYGPDLLEVDQTLTVTVMEYQGRNRLIFTTKTPEEIKEINKITEKGMFISDAQADDFKLLRTAFEKAGLMKKKFTLESKQKTKQEEVIRQPVAVEAAPEVSAAEKKAKEVATAVSEGSPVIEEPIAEVEPFVEETTAVNDQPIINEEPLLTEKPTVEEETVVAEDVAVVSEETVIEEETAVEEKETVVEEETVMEEKEVVVEEETVTEENEVVAGSIPVIEEKEEVVVEAKEEVVEEKTESVVAENTVIEKTEVVEKKTSVTAQMVKELRGMTGAGMMDCKKALTECEGDMEEAIAYLKKKGIASAAKRSGRIAADGMIANYIHHDGKLGILLEVNSETDFVARNEQFKNFVNDVAMTIASNPDAVCISPEDFPADILAKERKIEMSKDELLTKPENIREQILRGKLEKIKKTGSVLEQSFIRNPKLSVQDAVNEITASLGEKISIRRFERFVLGEGLEKKSTDFATEVTDQIEAKKAEAEVIVEETSVEETPPPAAEEQEVKVSALQVKELRQMTGGGILDCKKALVACKGDIEAASEYLRKKGLAGAAKKADRLASEGLISSYIHAGSKLGVMVEINCETDFVSRGEAFKTLVHDITLQIAACPDVEYLTVEDIPQEVREKELQIEKGKEDLLDKKEEIRERIALGRVEKTLKMINLSDQPTLKNSKVTVEETIKETIASLGENIKIRRFVRFNLGEGIEKKETNFAEEVAEQTNKV